MLRRKMCAKHPITDYYELDGWVSRRSALIREIA
jgi:hypothetical protein